jgi:hypothetical protein
MASSPNYPPGVTSASLPGFSAQERTLNTECEASRLYAPVAGFDEAFMTTVAGYGLDMSTRWMMLAELKRKIAATTVRADSIDPGELCGYDGPIDFTIDHGEARGVCPTCGYEIIHPQHDD